MSGSFCSLLGDGIKVADVKMDGSRKCWSFRLGATFVLLTSLVKNHISAVHKECT